MLTVSANEVTITAIVNPTTIRKTANKQIPPIIREIKNGHSSHSFQIEHFDARA